MSLSLADAPLCRQGELDGKSGLDGGSLLTPRHRPPYRGPDAPYEMLKVDPLLDVTLNRPCLLPPLHLLPC